MSPYIYWQNEELVITKREHNGIEMYGVQYGFSYSPILTSVP